MRKMTEFVNCDGRERGLEKCNIQYKSNSLGFLQKQCKLAENVVSVTCVHDSFAHCPEGEIPWGKSCYSVHFNRSTFVEAQTTCQKEGKNLVEITTQEENDLISELLMHNKYSAGMLSNIWTGGVGKRTARSQTYFWHGSKMRMDCKHFANF